MENFYNILVTGGCGFIGSNVLNYLLQQYPNINFVNYDCLTYCGNILNVDNSNENYFFVLGDINDKKLILETLNKFNIDCIIHFAAETHVDNSFENPNLFVDTNIHGTINLLESIRIHKVKKFIHVSTDEVYGEVHMHENDSTTDMKLNPTNPYSASKAAAEHFVNVYGKCYNLPVLITRGNNVFGPRQYPEKLIPKFIKLLLENKKCTVHGNGENLRNFIYTESVAKAFEKILIYGEVGQVYNIGSKNEYSVKEILKKLVKIIKNEDEYVQYIEYINDRPFNDFRYAIDSSSLESLGWKDEGNFDEQLKETVEWYTKMT